MAEPRHELRAQHAVALARSAKPGPRAKPSAHLIRMRPTFHPRRDTSRPTCPKRSPPQLQQPIFASSHRSGRRFEQQPDGSPPTQRPNRGFCDHRPPTRRRHAARSLLWSQFPPPHLRVGTHLEHDHIGRDTLNTGHLRTPRAQSAIHLSYNSPFSPVLTKADYGLSNNPTAHSQLRGQTWGFCDHRPPTRRRHADRNLLWSQFPPHLRVGTHLEHDHIGRDTLNTEHLRTPRAQSPVHLSQNSPLSPVLTKVDDGLSSKPKLRPS